MMLQHYLASGLTKTAIARQLGVSRSVIYHWLKTGQLTRDVDAPAPGVAALPAAARRAQPRPGKLDPYRPLIHERLAVYPALSAVRLFAECRAAGYPGGYSQVKAYVAHVRPRPTPEPVVRFETAPGEQAQFDFASVRFPWGQRYALVVVLGYSRLLYVEFVPRQTALTVMLGLEHAFQAFGGVPREVLFDQMKSVVVEDHRPGGGRLLENAEFLRFATHWGFRVRACRPYRAKTKGKVERPIDYLRRNFLYGRTFLGDADVAAQCTHWLATVANPRVHGTTREAPLTRFLRDEQAVLQPLAARPYRSLVYGPVLGPPPVSATRARPPRLEDGSHSHARIQVEQRPLRAYDALLAELGEDLGAARGDTPPGAGWAAAERAR